MAYHRPKTLKDALCLLEDKEMRILAGGTDVFPALSGCQLRGDTLDITAIPGLKGIQLTPKGWRIGATATWRDVINGQFSPAFDCLKQAAHQVGSVQIQNTATVAGNLCNASPAADGVPPLLTLDAQVEIATANGLRVLPLCDFITGVRTVELEPGELVTAILIPSTATDGRSVFKKLGARKYLVISIAMVTVRICKSDDVISDASVAVGSCSPVARRLPELEHRLLGCSGQDAHKWTDVLETEIKQKLTPLTDLRATAEYRSNAVAHLVSAAISEVTQ